MDIKLINGNEILDFLNKHREENEEYWCDISIGGPIEFESQDINNGVYRLFFSGYYNNWGTDQIVEGNIIFVDGKGVVSTHLDEPFDMDESSDYLEEILNSWIKTHKFKNNTDEEYYNILGEAYEELGQVSYNTEELQKVINKLIKAKTYIK